MTFSDTALRGATSTSSLLLRVLAVVALVLGIVAMHALSGGTHTAGHAVVSATHDMTEPSAGTDVHVAPATAALESASMARDHSEMLMAGAACLAILVAALAQLTRTPSPVRTATPRPRMPIARLVAVPPGRGPPRLLLAQVGVLRI
jgi:hypothetical protein